MSEEKHIPTDILELLKFYHIDYKMVGNVAMVSCLFHAGDNTPSMAVYPETNSFYCFSCLTSGTPETLVMKMENCSYPQAVKLLYGEGYEWRKLKKDTVKENKVDEPYLYNIIGRNLRKELRSSLDKPEKLNKLKHLMWKYSHEQVKPNQLFSVLKEIKAS